MALVDTLPQGNIEQKIAFIYAALEQKIIDSGIDYEGTLTTEKIRFLKYGPLAIGWSGKDYAA